MQDYRDSWLYAIALLWDIEIANLQLNDRSAEAAFALRALIAGEGNQDGNDTWEEENEEDAESDIENLPWDTVEEELPKELKFIWDGVKANRRRTDVPKLLATIPKYRDIPARGPENQVEDKKMDKIVRAWSTSVLQVMRTHVHEYVLQEQQYVKSSTTNPFRELKQQEFQLLCELFKRMTDWRKEATAPGSSAVAAGDDNLLFSKDEVQNVKNVNSINGLRFKGTSMVSVSNSKIITFPLSSGGAKGKSKGRGRGKSFGYQNTGYYGGASGVCQGISRCHMAYLPPGWRAYGRGKGKGGKQAPYKSMPRGADRPSNCSPLQAEQGVVGPVGAPGCGGNHQPRCASTVATRTRSLPAMARKEPYRVRCSSMHSGFAGLPSSGSSDRVEVPSGNSEHEIFGAMVHHFKERRGGGQTQVDLRLQVDKQSSSASEVQDGSLEGHFPKFEKGDVGVQNRPPTCLFSPASQLRAKGLLKHQSGRKIFSVSGSPIWFVNPTRNLDKSHESVFEKVESKRNLMLDISGRHFGTGSEPQKFAKTHANSFKGSGGLRNGNQLQKEHFDTLPRHTALGFQHRLQRGGLQVPQEKLKSIRKELGKIVKYTVMSPRKMPAILGQVRSFLWPCPFWEVSQT